MSVLNFPGPYQIRLRYSTAPASSPAIQHTANMNINLTAPPAPGTPFASLTVVARGGAPQTLAAFIDAWVALLRPLIANAANNTVDYAELWSYAPGTFDATFVSLYPIALAGTAVSAASAAAESIIVFRTMEGGIMKVVLEELAGQGIAVPDTPPLANPAFEALQLFVVSGVNAWLGRDTSFPFATIALYPGQNEALFRKRFRP